MEQLAISNPFEAGAFYMETVASTMDEARRLALQGAPSGTVISAGRQRSGRGRAGRPWQSGRGNLYATLFLRFPSAAAFPPALTLRAGLAVLYAVERIFPALAGRLRIKWPNDVMILGAADGKTPCGKKAVGILTEASGADVFIGMGANIGEKNFPEELRAKATSIALELGGAYSPVPTDRALSVPAILLEAILACLYDELKPPLEDTCGTPVEAAWRKGLDEKLYLRGEKVRFICGAAGSGSVTEGILLGVDNDGALILRSDDGKTRSYITGELAVY